LVLELSKQVQIPVFYKGIALDIGFRLDLWVEDKLVIAVKSVSKMEELFMAQLLTYLKLKENKLGLLINFNVPLIKDGIKKVVNGL
jgi:GxxExxY protein